MGGEVRVRVRVRVGMSVRKELTHDQRTLPGVATACWGLNAEIL